MKRKDVRWSLLAYAHVGRRAHAEFKDDRAILSPVVDAISFRSLHHPDERASDNGIAQFHFLLTASLRRVTLRFA